MDGRVSAYAARLDHSGTLIGYGEQRERAGMADSIGKRVAMRYWNVIRYANVIVIAIGMEINVHDLPLWLTTIR